MPRIHASTIARAHTKAVSLREQMIREHANFGHSLAVAELVGILQFMLEETIKDTTLEIVVDPAAPAEEVEPL